MSLRDQLVAKGLVSKKKAREINREQRAARKSAQGHKKRKQELAQEAAEQQAAQAAEAASQRLEARRARQADRHAAEQRLQVRNLLTGNRLPMGRGQRFWHRSPDGRHVQEANLSSGLAFQLRCGGAALAYVTHRSGPEVLAIPRKAALRLQELAPERLLFFVEDAAGLSSPDLAFHRRDWDPELRARRATPEDLAALTTR